MSAKILDGREIALKLGAQIKKKVAQLKKQYGEPPRLASIFIGENPATKLYIASQQKVADGVGIEFQSCQFPNDISQKEVVERVDRLNRDSQVTGLILHFPLPDQINRSEILRHVNPLKDVDGLTPENAGQILLGRVRIGSCTAQAVMELIHATGVDLRGKEAVIVGHSELVGKPVGLMLLEHLATVTTCHIATNERGYLADHVKRAEVLVVAVGKPGLIQGDWIRPGAVVIDVGISRVNGRVVGDVEYEKAVQRAGYITPVPGGVGPLTVMMLMRNVVKAYKFQRTAED
ncbi:MAG: bifunctional 5,10-methylenetetrahydrofolate dehydrogenase/5,10-methenyltetrahydrofolate cyclohydrolase [Candidatus Omnitrophica bacterium]|nr:bifunctional 5,10-methylenetetrahydrofolate dehydrogenase/5,10-methenyltetrahydrofolate cyclohydrolase [Candidatus Omnitrophota bacterium]